MNPFAEGWGWWAVAFAVAVPLLLIVLTELIGYLQRRSHPAHGPVRFLRNWVVPAGAAFALVRFAMTSPAEEVWVRSVATLFGFLVILLVLSAFNVALFRKNGATVSWRDRVPTIFVEIGRVILVVLGLAILFQWVWGADVGGLFTALGVGSIVIGLALQNAVGGVVSGLLLLFEQPFKIGDWLVAGGVEGRVVEVNWRSVHIDTGSGLQIVPNSSLSGAAFLNKSRPEGTYFATVKVKFATDDPPHEVIALLVDVAHSLRDRAEEEPTAVFVGNAEYVVTLPIRGPGEESAVIGQYLAWLWYAARRRNLALDGDATDPLTEPERLQHALRTVSPVLQLNDACLDRMLASVRLERYGEGEVILRAREVPRDIYFVLEGRIRLAAETPVGLVDATIVEQGDFVGQNALTREPSEVTSVAHDVTTLLAIPVEVIDDIIRTRPLLAAEFGASIERRHALARNASEGLSSP